MKAPQPPLGGSADLELMIIGVTRVNGHLDRRGFSIDGGSTTHAEANLDKSGMTWTLDTSRLKAFLS